MYEVRYQIETKGKHQDQQMKPRHEMVAANKDERQFHANFMKFERMT